MFRSHQSCRGPHQARFMLRSPLLPPCTLQDLANHAASLNSTRGAAFGFASIAKLAGEQLKPYIDKVVPKLYRCGLCQRACTGLHYDSSYCLCCWCYCELALRADHCNLPACP